MPPPERQPAEYVAQLQWERDHWAKTCNEWADEATRRARFIWQRDEFASLLREARDLLYHNSWCGIDNNQGCCGCTLEQRIDEALGAQDDGRDDA